MSTWFLQCGFHCIIALCFVNSLSLKLVKLFYDNALILGYSATRDLIIFDALKLKINTKWLHKLKVITVILALTMNVDQKSDMNVIKINRDKCIIRTSNDALDSKPHVRYLSGHCGLLTKIRIRKPPAFYFPVDRGFPLSFDWAPSVFRPPCWQELTITLLSFATTLLPCSVVTLYNCFVIKL